MITDFDYASRRALIMTFLASCNHYLLLNNNHPGFIFEEKVAAPKSQSDLFATRINEKMETYWIEVLDKISNLNVGEMSHA